MHRAMLATLLIVAIALGALPGSGALGSVERPEFLHPTALRPTASLAPASAAPEVTASEIRKARRPAGLYARMQQDVLARLRPVERDRTIDFDEAGAMLNSKTTIEKVFDDDFEKKMRGQYAAQVKPFEATANDPIWRARSWERRRLEEGQQNLAKWTAREVLDDQLKDFISGGDKDSAPIKVLETAQELSGNAPDKKEEKLSPEEKAARAHRRDLPQVAQEERTPTKLKAKINVIKQHGSIVLQNPVAETSVNGSADEINVNMNKSFPKITLSSAANYVVKGQMFNLNLTKKITERVSLALDHYSWSGSKRGSAGETSKEQARVNYSVSF